MVAGSCVGVKQRWGVCGLLAAFSLRLTAPHLGTSEPSHRPLSGTRSTGVEIIPCNVGLLKLLSRISDC